MDAVDSDGDEGVLDPRIQIELENLNTATDEINRLEIELDEANTTFRILLNECTRRLKQKSKFLGSCVEKARPYYEALDVARQAQLECQRAAVQYQRANEIHQAAKETVALAEQRFLSKQHEWQFDNAWQEMLNHATIKVRDAETQKAESGREHHKRAMLFNAAEQKVQQLEQRLHRHIIKSRPYFEEKSLCNDQLAAQKERVEALQTQVAAVKNAYAASLKELERISEEIHHKRRRNKHIDNDMDPPCGPREPGVGAELIPVYSESTIAKDITCTSPSLKDDNLDDIKKTDEQMKPVVLEVEKHTCSNNSFETASTTPLPLLESLAQFKQFSSCESVTLTSPERVIQCAQFPLPTSFDSCGIEQNSSKASDVIYKAEEECSPVSVNNSYLLTHLMENYSSELDRCDRASLGSASVATGSSAVSERDENEVQVEEELQDLREQIQGLSTNTVVRKLPEYESDQLKKHLSHVEKKCSSVNQTPKKTLASSMSLPSLLLSSDSENYKSYSVDLSENTPFNVEHNILSSAVRK